MSVKSTSNVPWFYTLLSELSQDFPTEVMIEDKAFIHRLKTVMRLRPNTPIVLVSESHRVAYYGVLREIAAQGITVSLSGVAATESEKAIPICAVLSLLKGQKWDWCLQKLTEIGVCEIMPIISERVVVDVHAPEAKHDRWVTILRQAAEQSERVTIPKLYPVTSLDTFLMSCQETSQQSFNLVAAERQECANQIILTEMHTQPYQRIVFAIGPEGGWTEAELQAFDAHGFQRVGLGDKILRSETAAVYMASVLDYVQTYSIASP